MIRNRPAQAAAELFAIADAYPHTDAGAKALEMARGSYRTCKLLNSFGKQLAW
jgi:hypothetical protein